MKKLIKKLRLKLKKEKRHRQKLDNEIVEYHNDILFLDQSNFQLEQENTLLKDKLLEYEEIYLKDAKSEFDKHLQKVMVEARNIKDDENTFYKNSLRYLTGYVQALQKYSDGDTKEILNKIQRYKTKLRETKKSLNNIKYEKKSLLEKITKVSSDIKVFKNSINEYI